MGTWECDALNEPRMFYSKCKLYNGNLGDDCNNKFGNENYYQFSSANRFKRQRGEGCNKYKENDLYGKWNIKENAKQRFIEIKFTNGQLWRLKIVYLDKEFNLVTERE